LKQDKEDKRTQTIQYKKDKKDNLKQDKNELELGLWMLQLHAEGDGNSVRAGSCDIHSVVGYYAMLCKVYSKMKRCEYKPLFGGECKEGALPGSKYCVLHVDLPEDEESDEFKRINGLKEKRVKEKVGEGDFNFDGAKLSMIHFTSKIEGDLSFNGAVIREDASFRGAEIGGNVLFSGAEIGENASFRRAKIRGTANFSRAKIGEKVLFMDTEIGEYTIFNRTAIGGDVLFVGAKMGRDVLFEEAEIDGDVKFHCTEIKGVCSFKKAKFKYQKAQEEACRTARKTQERIGDRVEADYHFYREMEAKRKQKHLILRVLELPRLSFLSRNGSKKETEASNSKSFRTSCSIYLRLWCSSMAGYNNLARNGFLPRTGLLDGKWSSSSQFFFGILLLQRSNSSHTGIWRL
jgi:hypothetical protein